MKGKMAEGIRTRKHKIGIGSPVEHWMVHELKEWSMDLLNSTEYRNSRFLLDDGFVADLQKAHESNTVSKPMTIKAWQEINLHLINQS
jgi:hypothetical protein